MRIRLAQPEDLRKLAGVELSGAQSFRGLDVPDFIFHEASPAERWAPGQADGTVWVAEDDDGEVVAFLAGTRFRDRLHIDEFDVAEPAQNRGLGRRMMAEVIDWARAAGLESLSLTTFRSVPWNAPFYRSCGFELWDDGLPADVAAALAHEAEQQLKDRCAMRLILQRNGGA